MPGGPTITKKATTTATPASSDNGDDNENDNDIGAACVARSQSPRKGTLSQGRSTKSEENLPKNLRELYASRVL